MNDISKITFEDRDEFNRKPIAENIIKLLNSDIDLSPMVINGSWGTGKTEFCYKLINLMKQEDTQHIVYIDAFKEDHTNEPLFAVLAAIIKILPKNKINKFKKSCLPVLGHGTKYLAELALSAVGAGQLVKTLQDLTKISKQAIAKSTHDLVKQRLDSHINSSKDLSVLKKALKEIAKIKPITIFIDELDRCKPDFALQMLEIIKHVFDIKNINFMLVVNLEQLEASIANSYGIGIYASRYLDKFINYNFSLPEIKPDVMQDNYVSCQHYIKLIEQDENLTSSELNTQNTTSSGFVKKIIQVHKLSLREIATLVRNLKIYRILNNNCFAKDNWNSSICKTSLELFAIILFCFNKKLLQDLVDDNADAKKLQEFLGVFNEGHYKDLEFMIFFTLGKECSKNANICYIQNEEENQQFQEKVDKYFSPDSPNQQTDKPYTAMIKSISNKLNLN